MQAIIKSLLFVWALVVVFSASAAELNAGLVNNPPQSSFHDCVDCPEMVVIPTGVFDMGSDESADNEKPVHRVTISKAFAMSKTEVTQAQWKKIMGGEPSRFSNCGSSCPVEQISWDNAQEFILKLNAKTGKHYRLPSEAEWEYAARSGSNTKYPWGDLASHEFANYGEDDCCMGLALGRDEWVDTSPAASFSANTFGLHDMIGNVWEWVEDGYHDNYRGAPTNGDVWIGDGSTHVVRGGAWNFDPEFMRAAVRSRFAPEVRISSIGLRLVRVLP